MEPGRLPAPRRRRRSRIRQASRDLSIQESADLQSRYLKLAEMLGSVHDDNGLIPNLETRVSVIHGLDHLAQTSPSNYENVIKVLASYIRLNAKPDPVPVPLPALPAATTATTEIPGTVSAPQRRTLFNRPFTPPLTALAQLRPCYRLYNPRPRITGA